jgi:hypothetical protein
VSEQHDIQISIKHGPNSAYMTNLRGNTAAEVVSHAVELAAVWADIEGAVATIRATDVIAQAFPGTTAGGQTVVEGDPNAPFCTHGQRRKFISGTSKKTGKPYSMWVCEVENDPNRPKCDAVFDK